MQSRSQRGLKGFVIGEQIFSFPLSPIWTRLAGNRMHRTRILEVLTISTVR